jgi:hypothetical protein
MMLSPSLVGTLRTFNQMDPATRSGMLPVRDGRAFGAKVLTMTPPPEHPAPKAAHPLEGGAGNPVDPETLASEAGDKIKEARFDPYAFSPPKAPGMDLG